MYYCILMERVIIVEDKAHVSTAAIHDVNKTRNRVGGEMMTIKRKKISVVGTGFTFAPEPFLM